ncbi:hypothetical protein C3432_07280 [Citrobacter amalonaticus]|uniref:Uncharacterized protein n=1 Tax=Citrobacter amalonaticus TaxID=35703 RepID=A0A2S4RYK7_CITAM|nr:hypothetical protein C3432_07280 [Citrobacter amalonaticus]POT76729.1 hypothetical protein C3436_04540 [Citrobacter amalonaticus]POU65808.1 hypothetical protein C3430_10955 [Citrobacter amalonaticus]POV05965.1 hypothetical protein C3424_11840 [Citrobacter amalonaticus]
MYSRPWSKAPAWTNRGPDKALSPSSGNVAMPDGDATASYQVYRRRYFELAYSTWIMMKYYRQMLQGVIRTLRLATAFQPRAEPESPAHLLFPEPSDFAHIR